MTSHSQWVVTDIGPAPQEENRVFGPFTSKARASEWARENLCNCCAHSVMRLRPLDYEGDWQ